MPKATAVWLIENTTLTFDQIAAFCQLHPLEVKGIADGEVAVGIVGLDPTSNGQLTHDEIERCQADPKQRLRLAQSASQVHTRKRSKGPRYTPVSRRQDRPDAIAWVLKYHSDLTDAQIAKLIGTTKPTIAAVRDRTHWNAANLRPRDPVSLGLCSQEEMNSVLETARRRAAAAERRAARAAAMSEAGAPANDGTEDGSAADASDSEDAAEAANDAPNTSPTL